MVKKTRLSVASSHPSALRLRALLFNPVFTDSFKESLAPTLGTQLRLYHSANLRELTRASWKMVEEIANNVHSYVDQRAFSFE